jgi:hypothetical protein
MRTLRKQLSYANVMSSIAVFVVLGGGAYAATTLSKNSVGSTQIKAKAVSSSKIAANAVTSSKVKDGSLLSKDFKPGEFVGTPGPVGPPGAAGATGAKGETGSPGPFPQTLPSGATLRGTFAMRGYRGSDGATNGLNSDSISFGYTLAAPPTAHVILIGAAVPAGCSGTVDHPGAAPGHLCVFEGWNYNATSLQPCDPTTSGCSPGTTGQGVMLIAAAAANGIWDDAGTWAVTAP